MKLRFLVVALAIPVVAYATATSAQLDGLRSSAVAERQRLATLQVQQATLRKALDEVAAQIAIAKRQRKSLLPPGDLEALLRRSQALSADLTSLAKAVSTAQAQAERAEAALDAGLSEAISMARMDWEHSNDRNARHGLVDQIRSLKTEREQGRARVPLQTVPTVEPSKPSDNPEDLMEQADVLLDAQDKVQKQLVAVDLRITQVREERDLDRRMMEFLADESIFDERDRRLRGSETSSGTSNTNLGPGGVESGRGPKVTGGGPGVQGASSRGPATSGPDVDGPRSPNAFNQMPIRTPETNVRDAAKRTQTGDADSLEVLEIQRNQLSSLAQQLKAQAQALAARARSLK